MKRILSFLICSMFFQTALLQAQDNFVISKGMDLRYLFYEDEIMLTVSAPSLGWMAIGLNDKKSFENSDVKMLRYKDGQLESMDMIITGEEFKVIPDTDKGGSNDILNVKGKETNGYTKIAIKIPLNSKDRNDYNIEAGKALWLTMAYSDKDDFSGAPLELEQFQFTFDKQ